MPNTIHPALIGSAIAALCPSPALADHSAAGTGARSSGPIVGLSASTMAAGRTAVGLELALAKPDNRSDATLAALAGQHILAGQQPPGITLAGLLSARLPIDWDAQRQMLGFAGAGPDMLLQGT